MKKSIKTSQKEMNCQFSFTGGRFTSNAGLLLVQYILKTLGLKKLLKTHLVTDDKRKYYRYSDSQLLLQFLIQLLAGYRTDSSCQQLAHDAYFCECFNNAIASQASLSRFLERATTETVESLRRINFKMVSFFLKNQGLSHLIVDVDSTHFDTYGHQEATNYNAHYRSKGYHPLYAFESQSGYCLNACLRPGNVSCSNGAEEFIAPLLNHYSHLLFRMDSGFATPKLYDTIEKHGQKYLIKLKNNAVLSRLGDLSIPCDEDDNLSLLSHSCYSEQPYQAKSWCRERRTCQFSKRPEGELLYDVVSIVTNLTTGTSEEIFALYRKRGQAENAIKEMKNGFYANKTDSSTIIKNEVRMMMSCLAYNIFQFMKTICGEGYKFMTIKTFRRRFLSISGRVVKTARTIVLKMTSLYSFQEQFIDLYNRCRHLTSPPLLTDSLNLLSL